MHVNAKGHTRCIDDSYHHSRHTMIQIIANGHRQADTLSQAHAKCLVMYNLRNSCTPMILLPYRSSRCLNSLKNWKMQSTLLAVLHLLQISRGCVDCCRVTRNSYQILGVRPPRMALRAYSSGEHSVWDPKTSQ